MSHYPWLAQQAGYHMKTSDRVHCWSMGPAFLPGRWAPGHVHSEFPLLELAETLSEKNLI